MPESGPDPERAAREHAQQERAQYRAFVRDHHPDRGGDHDAFVAGLARLRHGPPDPDPDLDSRRYDAPIEIVHPLPLPTRVGVALIRTLRWHRQQRRVD